MWKWIGMLAGVALFTASAIWSDDGAAARLPQVSVNQTSVAPSTLSVMTYNVKGLPWPVGIGRSQELSEIGDHLGGLRAVGMQPQIVLLQEAFTDDAKAIGVKAGYRHILSGPNKASPQMPGLSAGDVGFARDASWFKGEDIGHWVDSGLVILSDYPITRGRQAIFPNDLCAGFDCIASKGVQLAWVNIPGRASPLAIVNTHLNSRRSSGVSIPRANKALMQQFSAARQFIEKNLPTDASAIFAGDFNVGRDEQRIRHANQVGGPLPGAREALTDALAQDRVESVSRADARKSRRNGKDLQFYRSTASFPFQLANLRVVFGTIGVGGHLSDHIGYAAEYSLH